MLLFHRLEKVQLAQKRKQIIKEAFISQIKDLKILSLDQHPKSSSLLLQYYTQKEKHKMIKILLKKIEENQYKYRNFKESVSLKKVFYLFNLKISLKLIHKV